MNQPSARKAAKSARPARLAPRVLAASLVAAFGAAPGLGLAQTPVLPTGLQVVQGTAPTYNSDGLMTVNNSNGAVLNWDSFSIGVGGTVNFVQPGSDSKVLNRVVGNNPSEIFGSLRSNGEVWLVNPHGVVFGRDAQINVGALVASTLGVTDNDFMNGRLRFGGDAAAASAGQVLNQAEISTLGGRVLLVGGSVQNEGVIRTPDGKIVLAAGRDIEMVDSGVPNITVRVTAPGNNAVNLGELLASNGSVDLHGAMVNQQGIVRADSLSSRAGRVTLRALGDITLGIDSQTSADGIEGGAAGSVVVESVFERNEVLGGVTAVSDSAAGGQVHLLGREVHVSSSERGIDASGETKGGQVLIGGSAGGADPSVPNAETVFVDYWTSIRANANSWDEGDGGEIVIRSDGATSVYGGLEVRGGMYGGTGGRIETTGLELDLRPSWVEGRGRWGGGEWLIHGGELSVIQDYDEARLPAMRLAEGESTVSNRAIASALGDGMRVKLKAGGHGPQAQSGNIRVAASIEIGDAPGSGPALELEADNDIDVDSDVRIGFGAYSTQISMIADADESGSGDLRLEPGVQIDIGSGNLLLSGRSVTLNGVSIATGWDWGSGAIAISGANVSITNGSVLEAGGRLGVHATNGITLTDSRLASSAWDDHALVLSSATLDTSGSELDASRSRWLVYLDSVPEAFMAEEFDRLGYQFVQVGAGYGDGTELAQSGPGVHGVIVRDDMDVEIKVDARREYNGGTRADFSQALSHDAAPGFAVEQMGEGSFVGEFEDRNAGLDKTVSIGDSEPPFALTTTTGQRVYGAGTRYVADITPKQLTATGLAALDKVYDATRNATLSGTLSGIVGDDDVSLLGASALFADKNVGAGKTVTVTGGALGGADGANYVLGEIVLEADITPRTIGAAGLAALDKVYDGSRAATVTGALSGALGEDDVRLVGASGLFDDKNAGAGKAVTISGGALGGEDARNYVLADGPLVARASITPRLLDASGLSAQDKVYDGTRNATIGGSLAGVLAGDSVNLTGATGLFEDKNAGAGKVVTVGGATLGGADAGNYRLAAGSSVRASITPRAIAASSLSAQDKVYDGTRDATVSGALSGVLAGDSVRLDGASGLFDDKNAGQGKTVTITGGVLGGADAGNYRLDGAGSGTAQANITPRAISASGLAALDKVYDGTRDATLTGSLSGVLAGDSVSLDGATGQFSDKNAGAGKTVTVSGALLGGADAGNYTLDAPADLRASITPRQIAVSGLQALDKVYDGSRDATVEGTLAGAVAGDEVSLTASGEFDTRNVGAGKTVTVSGALAGADAANYRVDLPATASADVTHRSLDIVVTGAVSREYDATTGASLAADGFALQGVVAGDRLAVRGPAQGSFADGNAGQGKLVTASGEFEISGEAASNYRVGGVALGGATNRVVASASGNVGTITPATLVYQANPGTSLGGLAGNALGGTVTGFKGGDNLANSTSGELQWTSPVNPVTAPGAHPIYGGGLSSQNYVLVQAPANATALELRPGIPAGAPQQRAQEAGTQAINSAVREALPTIDPRAISGALFDRSNPAAERAFAPLQIGAMNQNELAALMAQRRDFKRKLFADAVYKLSIDPSLADVQPCATAEEARAGTCRITQAQLALLHAARDQAASVANAAAPAAGARARHASLPQIERKIAVLVGINSYGDKDIPQLENAIPDADGVGRVFAEKLGYEVRVAKNPDKAGIIGMLNNLAAEVGGNDSVVIYFAGHGYSLEENGAGYWLAADSMASDPKGWISNSDIAQLLSSMRSKQMTLISDSCYSGAFAREGLGAVGKNVTADDVLAKRSVVVLSSGGDEPVADEGKGGHSIFAWNLMQVVNTVTAWTPGSTVFADVQAGVRKEFPQTPKYGSLTAAGHQAGGDYLFEQRSN
ncbi:YDG domain-containing protein [Telluria beijingensis]|uniref:YDG domain-containing protein n=1 Tax=Telluria beijingensis TaxID=3068633 RepID=UPI0027952DFF|nr:YDG domain-containing protein [Massilia sp. REN29]